MKIKPIKCSDFLYVLTACMEVWTQHEPNWSCGTSRSIKLLGHYQSSSGFSQQPSILSSHPFPKDFLDEFYWYFCFMPKLSLCTARFSPCHEHCQVSHGAHHTAMSADALCETSNWFCLFYAVRITEKTTAHCSVFAASSQEAPRLNSFRGSKYSFNNILQLKKLLS